jgi:hypothetical protein
MFHNLGFPLPLKVAFFVDILLQVLIVRYSVLTLLYRREISDYQSSIVALIRHRAAIALQGSLFRMSSSDIAE